MEATAPGPDRAGSCNRTIGSGHVKGDSKLESGAAPVSVWEVFSALIIAAIIFPPGLGWFCIPGLLLLTWAAMSNHQSSMPDLASQKRKREEDESSGIESNNKDRKQQRGIDDSIPTEFDYKEKTYEENITSTNLKNLSTTSLLGGILVGDISNLQHTTHHWYVNIVLRSYIS